MPPGLAGPAAPSGLSRGSKGRESGPWRDLLMASSEMLISTEIAQFINDSPYRESGPWRDLLMASSEMPISTEIVKFLKDSPNVSIENSD